MKPSFLKAALGAAIALIAIPVMAGEIILFENTDFAGRRMVIRDTMPNLDRTDFNDRTRSIIVREGVWELCSDARFEGYCTRVQPGEYRALGSELDKRISSVREVGPPSAYAPPQYAPPPQYPPSYDGPPPGHGGQVGAVLYEGSGFRGRSFEINRPVVRDLDRTSFNDRAESLRVYSGYWMFCSDANFEGECRTFGPGEYPQLPGDLNRRISSGRKISDRYPYGGQPNWGGGR
jgi:beta/gamma crystallin